MLRKLYDAICGFLEVAVDQHVIELGVDFQDFQQMFVDIELLLVAAY